MNEEEIKKALEIIKQPIMVNCIDYYYFNQENYDKLVTAFDNCQWFKNNVEQIIDNCNELQQENTQLKARINYYEIILEKLANNQELSTGQFATYSEFKKRGSYDK